MYRTDGYPSQDPTTPNDLLAPLLGPLPWTAAPLRVEQEHVDLARASSQTEGQAFLHLRNKFWGSLEIWRKAPISLVFLWQSWQLPFAPSSGSPTCPLRWWFFPEAACVWSVVEVILS